MYENLVLQPVSLTHLNEFEQVIEAGMHTAVAGQTHQVQFLIILLGIGVGSLHLRILHDGAVLASAVNLHKVLIDDASCTDVEVSNLRVTHLSVGQTYVLTAGLELRVGRYGCQIIQIRGRRIEDHVALAMLSDSPSIENHQ